MRLKKTNTCLKEGRDKDRRRRKIKKKTKEQRTQRKIHDTIYMIHDTITLSQEYPMRLSDDLE